MKAQNLFSPQNRRTQLPLLVASIGVLLFLVASFTLPFNKGLFTTLFQKPSSHASTNMASINLTPSSTNMTVGVPTSIVLSVNGGGMAFNAAQATVTVSSNLTIQSLIIDTSSSGCNFQFLTSSNPYTPTVSNPSFVGTLISSTTTTQCNVYTMVVVPNAAGTGTITLQNGSVRSAIDASEMLGSMDTGNYTIVGQTPPPSPSPSVSPSPLVTASPSPSGSPGSSPIPATATINVMPSSQTVTLNTPFTATIQVDGGGNLFNSAQAKVTPSSNLTIQSLTMDSSTNGCNFFLVSQPTPTSPSFSGADLAGSLSQCVVYSMSLLPTSTGPASITLSNAQVRSAVDTSEILEGVTNGAYTVVLPQFTSSATVAPTSVAAGNNVGITSTFHNAGATSQTALIDTEVYDSSGQKVFQNFMDNQSFTAGQTITSNSTWNSTWNTTEVPAGSYTVENGVFSPGWGTMYEWNKDAATIIVTAPSPSPSPSVSPSPRITPPPSVSPSPSPSPAILPVPQVNSYASNTYNSSEMVTGTRQSTLANIEVLDTSGNSLPNVVTLPTSTTFSLNLSLTNYGNNVFTIKGLDGLGNFSQPITVIINKHVLGDINGQKDSLTGTSVGIDDFELFVLDYGKNTSKGDVLTNPLSDMNGDGIVDLTDFSIFARQYGK